MDDWGERRASVLGNTDAPNASRRTIVMVLSTFGIVGLVLLTLIVSAVFERPAEPRSADAERQAPARTVPPPDRRLAGARLRGNPAAAFGADAYPAEAVRRGEQGRTVAMLTVDASGTPTDCAVISGSGSASLDRATCRIALARVRYQPARDEEGRPIASAAKLPVRWVLP